MSKSSINNFLKKITRLVTQSNQDDAPQDNDWLNDATDYLQSDNQVSSEVVGSSDSEKYFEINPTIQQQLETELKRIFGYDTFRPGQLTIIDRLLKKQDVLALLSTGYGKSICYQLPMILSPGTGVIISPLISLMSDQVLQLKRHGINVEYYNSSLDHREQHQIMQKLRNGEVKLIYISPEKIDHNFLQILNQIKINYLAIDEAHCVSEWGHDFRPSYSKLWLIRHNLQNQNIPLIALTATATEETQKDIISMLKLNNYYLYRGDVDRPNIYLEVSCCKSQPHRINRLKKLINDNPNQAIIIYTLFRIRAERVAAQLNNAGINSCYYHGNLDNQQRKDILELFNNNKINVIVATKAFGMGINNQRIKMVVHMEPPLNLEGYYQEIGRSGRDGSPAKAVLYYCAQDFQFTLNIFDRNDLEGYSYNPNSSHSKQKYQLVKDFVLSSDCRRQPLLSYFDETLNKPCGNCDNCLTRDYRFDASSMVYQILNNISKSRLLLNDVACAAVLVGDESLKDTYYGELEAFASGKSYTKKMWRAVIEQMLNLDYLQLINGKSNHLAITQRGYDLLQKPQPVYLLPIN